MSEPKKDVWGQLGDEIGNFLLQSFRAEMNENVSDETMSEIFDSEEPWVELLAAHSHDEQWSGWMQYLFSKGTENPDGSFTIPASWYWRWKYQASTPYADLPEDMKESDREEARGILKIMGSEG